MNRQHAARIWPEHKKAAGRLVEDARAPGGPSARSSAKATPMHSRSIIRCHYADGGDGLMINLVIGTRDDLDARDAKVSARNATSNSTFFTVWCGCPRPANVLLSRTNDAQAPELTAQQQS